MTYEVPSASDASEDARGAFSPMMEGAAVGAGIELGGAAIPVAGELGGGFLASLALSAESGKTYANRRAAEEAVVRLIE